MSALLVLGGVRSGKSAYAERVLTGRDDVTYIAPGPAPSPRDHEWSARISAHRARRPGAWRTVETADAATAVRSAPDGSAVLLDCLGTWLTRIVDDAAAWEDSPRAHVEIARAGDRLLATVRQRRAHLDVVLVSNEVGLGVVPPTASGRLFRDALGRLNAGAADVCDHVALVVAGRVLDLGEAPTLAQASTFGMSR